MHEKENENQAGSATVFVDANPEPDQTFLFDAYPDPEPTFLFYAQVLHMLENGNFFITFIHPICFVFRISVISFIIFSILGSLLKLSGKRSAGSGYRFGSGKKMPIRPDPDIQHCPLHYVGTFLAKSRLSITGFFSGAKVS
jgi:hypothetical protein